MRGAAFTFAILALAYGSARADSLYVSETNNNNIERFSPTGVNQGASPAPGWMTRRHGVRRSGQPVRCQLRSLHDHEVHHGRRGERLAHTRGGAAALAIDTAGICCTPPRRTARSRSLPPRYWKRLRQHHVG